MRILLYLLVLLFLPLGAQAAGRNSQDLGVAKVPMVVNHQLKPKISTLFSFDDGMDTVAMDGFGYVWIAQSYRFDGAAWNVWPVIRKYDTAKVLQAQIGNGTTDFWGYTWTATTPWQVVVYIRGVRNNGNIIVMSAGQYVKDKGTATEQWFQKLRYHEIDISTSTLVNMTAPHPLNGDAIGKTVRQPNTLAGDGKKFSVIGAGWFDYEVKSDALIIVQENLPTARYLYNNFSLYRRNLSPSWFGAATHLTATRTPPIISWWWYPRPFILSCPTQTYVMYYECDTCAFSIADVDNLLAPVTYNKDITYPLYCDSANTIFGTNHSPAGSATLGHNVGVFDKTTGNITTYWGSITQSGDVDGFQPNSRMRGPVRYQWTAAQNRPNTFVFVDLNTATTDIIPEGVFIHVGNLALTRQGKIRVLSYEK